MIYKFKSKAAGDVIMMGPSGDQVLRAIGKSPAASGILEAATLPGAIQALEAAIAADDATRANDRDQAEPGNAREPAVTLRQRAWPMVEMMKQAIGENADIVWGV